MKKRDLTTQGGRIKARREELGIEQGDLCEAVGIKQQSTLSRIEHNKQKTTTVIAEIADELLTTVAWLKHGKGPPPAPPSLAGNVTSPKGRRTEDAMLYQWPDPRCTAGPNAGNPDAAQLPVVEIARATLARLGIEESEAIGYIQSDPSMGDSLRLGDGGLIDTREVDPVRHSGLMFALAVGDTLIVRRVMGYATGRLTISCDNRDKSVFPDEELSASEAKSVRIVGRLRHILGDR